MIIGYARTSTMDQVAGLEAQVTELKAAGCEQVYQEHVSAITNGRPELEKAIAFVRDGDTFTVAKPDRLARSITDLLQIVERLRAKKVTLRILSMGLDTASPTGSLILTVLGAVAEFERTMMLERQRVGIAAAKMQGKYKGRAPTARAKADQVRQLHADGIGCAEIAKQLGIGRASVYRCLEHQVA
jgi:DNA invertase Pin-like site-specific DNA recombinase